MYVLAKGILLRIEYTGLREDHPDSKYMEWIKNRFQQIEHVGPKEGHQSHGLDKIDF